MNKSNDSDVVEFEYKPEDSIPHIGHIYDIDHNESIYIYPITYQILKGHPNNKFHQRGLRSKCFFNGGKPKLTLVKG